MKAFAIGIASLIGALALIFLLNLFGLANFGYFAPKMTEVQRRTFEESRAFNEGAIRDLDNLRLQYAHGTPEQRAAVAATVRHRFSVYPKDRLPPDLLSFYNEVTLEQ